MTNIKIFISSELYFSCNNGNLFGYVKQFNESIAFYLLRCHRSKDSNSCGNGQWLGTISDDTDYPDDAFNFVQFVNGSENILLNRVTINGSTTNVSIESVQIILYDHNRWIEASADLDGDIDTTNEDCIIKCLGLFIHDDFKSTDENTSCCTVKILEIFGFVLVPMLNMVNKLAVVKHMIDWWNCLNGGLGRK